MRPGGSAQPQQWGIGRVWRRDRLHRGRGQPGADTGACRFVACGCRECARTRASAATGRGSAQTGRGSAQTGRGSAQTDPWLRSDRPVAALRPTRGCAARRALRDGDYFFLLIFSSSAAASSLLRQRAGPGHIRGGGGGPGPHVGEDVGRGQVGQMAKLGICERVSCWRECVAKSCRCLHALRLPFLFCVDRYLIIKDCNKAC